MRILLLAFGYPASDAQKCGAVLPPLQLPRMDRCWWPMIRAAPSGAFPTPANARAPPRVQIEPRTAGPNKLSPARFAKCPLDPKQRTAHGFETGRPISLSILLRLLSKTKLHIGPCG